MKEWKWLCLYVDVIWSEVDETRGRWRDVEWWIYIRKKVKGGGKEKNGKRLGSVRWM